MGGEETKVSGGCMRPIQLLRVSQVSEIEKATVRLRSKSVIVVWECRSSARLHGSATGDCYRVRKLATNPRALESMSFAEHRRR